MKLESKFKEHWLFYFLMGILAALYVHTSSYYIQPDLDGGLVWALNDFFSFRHELPKFYPHTNGPLYLLKVPSEQGYHLLFSALFNFIIRFILGFYLLKIASTLKKDNYLAIIVLVFFLSLLNFDFIIIAAVLAGAYYLILTKHFWSFLPSAILITIGMYTKGSISIPCLAISFALILILIYQKKQRTALWLVGLLLGVLLLISSVLYNNPFDGFSWIINSITSSLAYGSNQGIYFSNSLFFLIPALVSIAIVPFFFKDKKFKTFYKLSILLIPIFWKYVLGRQDFTHYQAWYFLCFLLIGFSFLLFEGKTRLQAIAVYSLSFLFFMTNCKRGDSPKQLILNTPSLTSFASATLNANKEKLRFTTASIYWHQNQLLSDSMLHIIGNQSVDVFPWEISIIRKYDLNYKARPNFISSLLGEPADHSDSVHFAGNYAPEYLIWHNTQASTYSLNAHNNNYLPNTTPKAIQSIQANYELLFYENGYAFWKKKVVDAKTTLLIKNKIQDITLNQWFVAPAYDSGRIAYGKTNFTLSLSDKIRSGMYKGRFFKIIYQLKNHEQIVHSLSQEALEQHILLQPYFINPSMDFYLIDSIKIEPLSKKLFGTQLKNQISTF